MLGASWNKNILPSFHFKLYCIYYRVLWKPWSIISSCVVFITEFYGSPDPSFQVVLCLLQSSMEALIHHFKLCCVYYRVLWKPWSIISSCIVFITEFYGSPDPSFQVVLCLLQSSMEALIHHFKLCCVYYRVLWKPWSIISSCVVFITEFYGSPDPSFQVVLCLLQSSMEALIHHFKLCCVYYRVLWKPWSIISSCIVFITEFYGSPDPSFQVVLCLLQSSMEALIHHFKLCCLLQSSMKALIHHFKLCCVYYRVLWKPWSIISSCIVFIIEFYGSPDPSFQVVLFIIEFYGSPDPSFQVVLCLLQSSMEALIHHFKLCCVYYRVPWKPWSIISSCVVFITEFHGSPDPSFQVVLCLLQSSMEALIHHFKLCCVYYRVLWKPWSIISSCVVFITEFYGSPDPSFQVVLCLLQSSMEALIHHFKLCCVYYRVLWKPWSIISSCNVFITEFYGSPDPSFQVVLCLLQSSMEALIHHFKLCCVYYRVLWKPWSIISSCVVFITEFYGSPDPSFQVVLFITEFHGSPDPSFQVVLCLLQSSMEALIHHFKLCCLLQSSMEALIHHFKLSCVYYRVLWKPWSIISSCVVFITEFYGSPDPSFQVVLCLLQSSMEALIHHFKLCCVYYRVLWKPWSIISSCVVFITEFYGSPDPSFQVVLFITEFHGSPDPSFQVVLCLLQSSMEALIHHFKLCCLLQSSMEALIHHFKLSCVYYRVLWKPWSIISSCVVFITEFYGSPDPSFQVVLCLLQSSMEVLIHHFKLYCVYYRVLWKPWSIISSCILKVIMFHQDPPTLP